MLISVLKAYSRPKDFADCKQIMQRIITNIFNTSTQEFRVYTSEKFSVEALVPLLNQRQPLLDATADQGEISENSAFDKLKSLLIEQILNSSEKRYKVALIPLDLLHAMLKFS